MSLFRSLSSSHRAQRQEAQSISENIIWKEVVLQAHRGARRNGVKFDYDNLKFYEAKHSNSKEIGNGWTVTAYMPMEQAFKAKAKIEPEISLAFSQYKSKATSKIQKMMTKPEIRVDGYGIYFDIFLLFPE